MINRKKRILKLIIKKDEIISWNSQKSHRALSWLILACFVFINFLFMFILEYESHKHLVLIMIFVLIAFLIPIIILTRDYLRIRPDDTIHFISNMRIGKIKFVREDSGDNSFILDEIHVEDLTSIQIFHDMENRAEITINFLNKNEEIFQFVEWREVLKSLKKFLIKHFKVEIIEKFSPNF